jgi:hypothetical protein
MSPGTIETGERPDFLLGAVGEKDQGHADLGRGGALGPIGRRPQHTGQRCRTAPLKKTAPAQPMTTTGTGGQIVTYVHRFLLNKPGMTKSLSSYQSQAS